MNIRPARFIIVRTIIALAVAVLIAGSPALLQAQEKRPLSVDDAIRIGIENSKPLHASRARVDAADAKQREVDAARLPSLKLNAEYRRLSPVDPFEIQVPGFPQKISVSPSILDTWTARMTLVQPLFTGFRLSAGSDAAEYSARAAAQDFDRDAKDLAFNIRAAYWNVYRAGEFARVVDETVDMVAAHLRDAENLAAQGMLTRNDVLKVQVQLSNVRLQQIDARNAVRLSKIALNNLIGLPLEYDIVTTSTISDTAAAVDALPTLIDRATQARPDLRAMEYRVKAGEAGVTGARAGWYPQISLSANYLSAKPNQRIVPSRNQFNDTWDVGVGLSFDIWNWRTTAHQTAQAQALLAQAQDGLGQLRDALALEVTQNWLALGQAQEKIGVARTAIDQAQEQYRITDNRYKQGLALTTDLLDADVALLQARVSFTQALVEYEIAAARLARSIGA